MGHSMGAGSALMFVARNPDRFKSVSAIAPRCTISSPASL